MFYLNQFNTFADEVDKLVPTDRQSQSELMFVLPGDQLAKAQYVSQSGGGSGTVFIYWDYDGKDFASKTEVDSLDYAIDAVKGLIRDHGGNTDRPEENESFKNASADDIAGDIVSYLYDKHPGASYIGDKEGQDGSIMLRFDWGKEDQAAIQNELKERYGERVAFTGGQLKYAPEIKLSFIRVLPINDIERQVADNIDTAMMDHYDMMNGDIGDFESTGFNAKVKALCYKAGKPALAEAIINLRNLYKSQMEAGETTPQSDWRSEYGNGGIVMHENSADGFFAKPNHPIGYAILTNNTKMLTKLRSGKVKAKDAYNIVGFEEDLNREGKYVYNFERGYEVEFEQDWERVVGDTDNQKALRLMLEFVPDFWLCPIDFYNAFSAGYDKTLLATLLRNYPTPDDPNNSYLPWEGVSFDEVLQFLET